MNERSKFAVIGGFGVVGRSVCAALAAKHPGDVIAVGRTHSVAPQYSGAAVVSRTVEALEPSICMSVLTDAHTVIMCVDQTCTRLVESCIAAGIHYIDVTASYDWQKRLQSLDETADRAQCTAVLGVGLAPGITTLLAAACAQCFEQVASIDISVLLGSGDEHGKAALRWTLQNLLTQDEGASPKQVDFGARWGTRTAIPFGFSDQHVLREKFPSATIQTRLAIHPSTMMLLLGMIRRWNPTGRARSFLTSDVLASTLHLARIGSDDFVLKVDAEGTIENRRCSVSARCLGRKEASVTARVAAFIAEACSTGWKPHGVFDMHEVVELAEVADQFAECDLKITGPNRRGPSEACLLATTDGAGLR